MDFLLRKSFPTCNAVKSMFRFTRSVFLKETMPWTWRGCPGMLVTLDPSWQALPGGGPGSLGEGPLAVPGTGPLTLLKKL